MIEKIPGILHILQENMIGTKVPAKNDGVAGKFIEQEAGKYLALQNGKGPDYEKLGIELKSRDIDSTSALTFGVMPCKTIITKEYADTHLCRKMQQLIYFFTQNNYIKSIKHYDFSSYYIQKIIKESYDYGKKQIKSGNTNLYIPPDGNYFYFEDTAKNNQYQFRISKYNFTKITSMSKQSAQFDNLFEERIAI